MATTKKKSEAFDPHLGVLTRDPETSSMRIRAKLDDHLNWCFCELCWRSTEYAETLASPTVVKRLERKNAKRIPLTDAMRSKAEKRAEEVAARYSEAYYGKLGLFEMAAILRRYCDISALNGDMTPESFKDHVYTRILYTEWGKSGEVARQTKLTHQAPGTAKPSRLYCEYHNPRRSDEARRAYQRDRRFIVEFEHLIDCARRDALNAGLFKGWNINTMATLRRTAYKTLQSLKYPTRQIFEKLANKEISQAEVARQLGISRQAVSAALKKQRAAKPD